MVKRMLWISSLVALGVFFIYIGCPERLPKGVYYTTSNIYSFQALDTSRTFGFVNLLYKFPPTVDADSVVIVRLEPEKRWVVKFDRPLVWSDLDTLKARTQYRYALSLLTAGEETPYDTVSATTLPEIAITSPQDTVLGDTLRLRFETIARGGKRFKKYEVAILRGKVTPEGPVKVDTVWSDKFEVAGADTLILIPRGDWELPGLFTVKVSTSELVELLTDSSAGYRTFLWVGLSKSARRFGSWR